MTTKPTRLESLIQPVPKDKGRCAYISNREGPQYAHLPKRAVCEKCGEERDQLQFRLRTRPPQIADGTRPAALEPICKICKPTITRKKRADIVRFYKPAKMDKTIIGNLLYTILMRQNRKLLKEYLAAIIKAAIEGDVQCIRMIGDVLKDVEVRVPIREQDAGDGRGLIPVDEQDIHPQKLQRAHVAQDIMERLGITRAGGGGGGDQDED